MALGPQIGSRGFFMCVWSIKAGDPADPLQRIGGSYLQIASAEFSRIMDQEHATGQARVVITSQEYQSRVVTGQH